MKNGLKLAALLLMLSVTAGCASTGELIDTPNVTLRNVEVTDLDFSGQTFLLGFDVTNPNAFPLPIKSVSYGVELDGYRFASGATNGNFTVPASGDASFAISVKLDLLSFLSSVLEWKKSFQALMEGLKKAPKVGWFVELDVQLLGVGTEGGLEVAAVLELTLVADLFALDLGHEPRLRHHRSTRHGREQACGGGDDEGSGPGPPPSDPANGDQ